MNKKGVLTESEEKEFYKAIGKSEVIEKEASISWDGRNLLLRLPKEIADYLGVEEENEAKKKIVFKIKETNGKVKKECEIID